jgi:hypothetical protein
MPPRTAGFGNRDRFESNGKILVRELRATGAEAEFVQTDVRHEEEVKNLVVSVASTLLSITLAPRALPVRLPMYLSSPDKSTCQAFFLNEIVVATLR